jgi:hypothetical protein
LVQQVLRDSYIETTEDLRMFAEKVKFFNDVKKQIREELKRARQVLAKNSKKKDEDALDEPFTEGTIQDQWFGDATPTTGKDNPTAADGSATSTTAGTCKTKKELDTYTQNLEDKLNTVGDDAQLANVDLQNCLQKQQQTLQMMSNISKMLYDTAMAVIRKIGG